MADIAEQLIRNPGLITFDTPISSKGAEPVFGRTYGGAHAYAAPHSEQAASALDYAGKLKDGLLTLLYAGGIRSVGKISEDPELQGQGYLAVRKGSRMLVSDELYRGDNPTPETVAAAASFDPKARYILAHEAFEEAAGSPKAEDARVHKDIHLGALVALYGLGDDFGVRAGVELGRNFDYGKGIEYETVAHLFNAHQNTATSSEPTIYGGEKRVAGQPQVPGIITGTGRWLELQSSAARVAHARLQDPNTAVVYGPLSFLSYEMEGTGYILSPISDARAGIVFTAGPRREPEFEQVQMAQTTPLAGGGQLQTTRSWRQPRP